MKSIRSVICFCLFLFVFNQLLFADKTIENDSLYTSEYISRIYMAEPERALSLLDGAVRRLSLCVLYMNYAAGFIVICI